MRFTTLLFDADNTLFDFDRSSEQAFHLSMSWLGMASSDAHFARYLQINRECWALAERGELPLAKIKYLRFSRFLMEIGHQGDPVATNDHYLDALASTVILIEGASELLAELQADGRQLALITNGLKEVQRRRLAGSGLAGFFQAVIVSDEIGLVKPDPAFFRFTLEQLSPRPAEEVLVIGDNPHSDIQGGHNAGLATCWYNPARLENPLPDPPTYEVRSLREIVEVVG